MEMDQHGKAMPKMRKAPHAQDRGDKVIPLGRETLEEVLVVAARRKTLMSRMRQACLDDNIPELKRIVEIYCGLREDTLP